MERQNNWIHKLAGTALVMQNSYNILIHDMPLSLEPDNHDKFKDLQKANEAYNSGTQITRAVWLKNSLSTAKKSGSLIMGLDNAEQTDKAITKGIMWKYDLKVA